MATAVAAAVGPLLVPGGDPVVRWLVAAGLAATVLVLHRAAMSGVLRDLRRMEVALDEVGEEMDAGIALPVSWSVLAPLADSVVQAHGRVQFRMRLLEQQREDLAGHLTRTEERLRDPLAEARRDRISRLGDLQVLLTVGGHMSPAALLDLSLDAVVLGVKPDHAERLVPGLPIHLSMEVEGTPFDVGTAVVLAPARGGLLDLQEWVFRFEPGLSPRSLPPALAKALELRGAERVRPMSSNPVHATVVSELGRIQAEVVDVSSTGLGIGTPLDAKGAGKLGTAFTIQLHLPGLGEMAVLPVTLRNMAVRSDGVRMGLSFDRDADPLEVAKVETWIASTIDELSLDHAS